MNKDEFIKDFTKFLNSSTTNLGRKNTETKKQFITDCIFRIDSFIDKVETKIQKNTKQTIGGKDIMVIKPKKQNTKGCNIMTQAESENLDKKG